MNVRTLSILGLTILLPMMAAGVNLKLDSIQVGSVTYSNVVITQVNPADIYFAHTGGMANIKLRQLDPRLQRKLNFDPEKAADIEVSRMNSDEEYKRQVIKTYQERIAQEQASALTTPALPFSLTDPINAQSPLNKPAPPLNSVKWVSATPPPTNDKFLLLFFWNNASLASHEFIPVLNTACSNQTDKLVVAGLSSDSEAELKSNQDPIAFYNGCEPTGKLAATLGITSVPSVALIDPKGILRYAGHPAALTDDALNKLMARYGAQ